MLKLLKRLLGIKEETVEVPKREPKVHYCDGLTLFFFDYKTRRITGWSYDVREGDEIRCKMASGKVARFRVTSLDRMTDPTHQYFGDVTDIGYVNEASIEVELPKGRSV